MSISQSWSDARRRSRQAIPGMCLALAFAVYDTFLNQDPQAVQISTYTVDTATNAATYTVEVNGQSIAIVAASGTGSAIAEQIADAINADPLAGAVCSAEASGSDIVLTGRTPGLAFTATESDAKLSVVETQAAAEAAAVAFGVAIKDTGFNGSEPEKTGALLSGFTAQVATIDYSYTGSSELGVRVYEIRGDERILLADAKHLLATSKAASTTALLAELNAALPANTVAATAGGSDEVVLTAEVAGLEFAAEVYSDDHANVAPSIAETTGPSLSTSAGRAFAGVSRFDPASEAASVGANAGQYAANDGIKVAQKDHVWVSNSESPSNGGTVYVDVSTGLFYASASSARVALPKAKAKWLRDGRDGDAIALLHVNA